jgi:hypothetical protein
MLALPVVMAKSALLPAAVLPLPSVLLKRANAPMAVLSCPVLLLRERPDTSGSIFVCCVGKQRSGAHTCVKFAVGQAQQRIYTNGGVVDSEARAARISQFSSWLVDGGRAGHPQ